MRTIIAGIDVDRRLKLGELARALQHRAAIKYYLILIPN